MSGWNFAAAAVQGGSGIVGPLVGANESENARHQNEMLYYDNWARQKEFAQSGIQWRVQDATAAGLHPLFALGAQVTPGQPVHAFEQPNYDLGEGLRRGGQDVSQAIGRLDPAVREAQMVQLELQRSQATKNYAEAAAAQSRAMRDAQGPPATLADAIGGTSGGGDGIITRSAQQFLAENQGAIEMVAPKRHSSMVGEPGLEAGTPPGFMNIRIPGTSVELTMPATNDIGETLSEMDNPIALAGLLIMNRKVHGPYWLRDFIREVIEDERPHTLDSEPKPGDYTFHQFIEAMRALPDHFTREKMFGRFNFDHSGSGRARGVNPKTGR